MTKPPTASSSIEIAGLERGIVNITRERLASLGACFSGPVLRDGDPGWDDAVTLWNAMAAHRPALVLAPHCVRDVLTAVRFAREHGLRLSVKGGGHNIAGTCIAEGGLMLDMSHLREVTVNAAERLAHVGAGCLLSDVDRATQRHGLATVLGFVSEVGVAGLVLGGGLGYLTRRFGWTADNLQEVELVTADGELRTASRDENADLFWALRGGGGNFGVVTRFTLRLHPVGPTVYGGLIAWPFARGEEILARYRALTSGAAPELSVWLILFRAPPAPFVPIAWHGERICAMAVCYTGELQRTERALAPIRALGEPIFDLLQERPYTELQSYLDCTEPKGNHYYWKTEYTSELSDALLSTWRDLAAECPIPEAELGILHLAGALNQRDADDGAVGNRNAQFALGALGMWEPHEPRAAEFRQWVRDAWSRFRPFSCGNYVNFQTADEGDERIRESYGENLARLTAVKRRYDPDNLFRSNRNIRGEGS